MRRISTLLLTSILLLAAACHKDPPVPSVTPEAGTTVYGQISCNGKGLPGVVVSDGYAVAVTGQDGVYQLKSDKKNGYVFVSVPSGYEVPTAGIIPQFYRHLNAPASRAERADFALTEADQSEYTMLFFGDIHLAGRSFCHDIDQFKEFTADVREFIKGKKAYALTLGDMSWDVYWSSNGFDLPRYLSEMTEGLRGLPVFHTMGNHDNDKDQAGDFNAAGAFRTAIGPNWYSFNAGGIHYIVLDDVLYINDPLGERNFSAKVPDEELAWLRKDLSFVSKDTPLVLTSHVPFYRNDGSEYIRNVKEVLNVLKGYNVNLVSGHTHVIVNTDLRSSDSFFERNAGAVCAAWWVSGSNYPGLLLCTDGTPGGYKAMTVKDNAITSWQYKGTGRPEDYRMRTYDRNEVLLDSRWVSKTTADRQKEFLSTVGEYSKESTANEVLINAWDYDNDWTLTVTENGKELPVTRLKDAKDPLYLVTYEAYQLNNGYSISYPCEETGHIFKVTASSPSSTLEITLTDPYGRKSFETMTRPKPFIPSEYQGRH